MTVPKSDKAAVRQVIRGLKAAGFKMRSVSDGEDLHKYTTEDKALDDIMAADDGYLNVYTPDGKAGWVWFVFGNSPEEVVADYTTNLDPTLGDLTRKWWE